MGNIQALETLSGSVSAEASLSGKLSCAGGLNGRVSVTREYDVYSGEYQVVPKPRARQFLPRQSSRPFCRIPGITICHRSRLMQFLMWKVPILREVLR